MRTQRKPQGFDYQTYLRSEAWGVRRQWKLDAAGHKCQVCASEERLQVHHRTYDNVGNEPEWDLVVLCDDCHRKHHGIENEPDQEVVQTSKQSLSIIANPKRWGPHATRVAEIHRELRIVGSEGHLPLLVELEEIAKRRRVEVEAGE